jgi:hypothetical protein
MKNSEAAKRKRHYEAPELTLLKFDRAKAQLVARALAGDRDAEDLLEASMNGPSVSASYTKA